MSTAKNPAINAKLLIEADYILGEGIQWNIETQRLYWTDIHGKRFCSAKFDGSDLTVMDLDERLCSFAFDQDGQILAAFESGLFRFDPDTARRHRLSEFEVDKPTTRMNDGRCDRQGRFIVGGMDEVSLRRLSSVMRVESSGTQTLFEEVGCTNSLCFSPDGRTMYFADTSAKDIFAFEYDPASGTLGEKRLFVRLTSNEGGPDGSCVDAEGALWNCQFNGNRVQRILPDGTRDIRINLPVPQVTCCCFGGPDLNRLFITTARENLNIDDASRYPLSGSIFYVDLPVRGLPEDRFNGRVGEIASL
ncbi:SMP-30/gluconolactonase/LRE family protein [Lacibacterium aquatile]|uniref:SMP-30/gluconolactonase/LRE family protein n=1 Tax=Lacibacterium aquatile TaxID=1168082 RepID=A0ABW5DXW6_9PROT